VTGLNCLVKLQSCNWWAGA